MKAFGFSFYRLIAIVLVVSGVSQATGVRLPLLTLRDQAGTAHCWSYAMSHALESRALARDGVKFQFDIEQDTKYWVDFERMWAIYKTKDSDIYLGSYEGGWQIEFLNALLKHGRPVRASSYEKADILYPVMKDFTDHMAFMPSKDTFTPDPSVPSLEDVRQTIVKGFDSDDKAREFMIDYLNKRWGKAVEKTMWLDSDIAVSDVGERVLGADYKEISSVKNFLLVKPVKEGAEEKWVKYLGNRFWGIRQNTDKVLSMIRLSLDRSYPVTFDNVYHAMTIVGYEKDEKGYFYAVADSVPGKITWYTEADLIMNLNLVSFFEPAVKDQLPEKPINYIPTGRYDAIDNVLYPPAH